MKALIKKYDRSGPRYTSYPPVPFWKKAPTQEEWLGEIRRKLAVDPRLDLYLHVPFCEQLCYYCGCHRTITKDRSKGDTYADLLLKEWEIYQCILGRDFAINSVHFGGGTPTFLTPEALRKILTRLSPQLTYDFTGAVEVDPRTCTREHLELLRSFGFSRISLGIQDFHPDVQAKINRSQSFPLVEGLVRKLRELGFKGLNFDLIYGLPAQTKASVKKTIELVQSLSPDTVAFYSYAHLPDRIPNQRLIKEMDLPSPEEKLELYLLGQDLLARAGYVHVGMDHFARPDSFLSKEITRSFMGYTDKKSELLLGLGASAIGQSSNMFVQNEKDLSRYEEQLKAGQLPLCHGHILGPEEKEVSRFLQDLFCQGEITFPPSFGESFDDEAKLIELERDGLIVWKDRRRLIVTPLGKNFLRNIAMAIDPLLKESTPVRFSRTI